MKTTLILVLVTFCTIVKSQVTRDTIFKINGDIIPCSIIDESKNKIWYTLADGETYTSLKIEVKRFIRNDKSVTSNISTHTEKYNKDTLYFNNGDTVACKIISTADNKISYFLPSGAIITIKQSEINYFIQRNKKEIKPIVLTNNNSNFIQCGNYLKQSSKRLIIGISLNLLAASVAIIGTQITNEYKPLLIVCGALSLSGIIVTIAGMTDIGNAGYMLNPNNSISLNATKNGLTLAFKF